LVEPPAPRGFDERRALQLDVGFLLGAILARDSAHDDGEQLVEVVNRLRLFDPADRPTRRVDEGRLHRELDLAKVRQDEQSHLGHAGRGRAIEEAPGDSYLRAQIARLEPCDHALEVTRVLVGLHDRSLELRERRALEVLNLIVHQHAGGEHHGDGRLRNRRRELRVLGHPPEVAPAIHGAAEP